MKKQILGFTLGLALLGAVISASAQSTLTITGTGSGSLNGVGFTDDSFVWTLTFPDTVAYTGYGPQQPVYATTTSQITLNGGPVINVTGSPGLWFDLDFADSTSILYFSPQTGIPGGDILDIAGTPYWDGVSAYTSDANPGSSFNQFNNIATDQGMLDVNSGSVSLVTIDITPTPEPSTLALAGLGGLGLLLFRRRK